MKWTIETRKIKDLKDYSKNPRKLTHEQAAHLQVSLEKFGLIDKPIINSDNTIIGGHQRVRLLKKMGHKEVECYVPEVQLTDKEVEELNIRHNKNTGEFDFDILANEFEPLDLISWGFDEQEIFGDIAQEIDGGEEEEDDDAPEPCKDIDAATQAGDVYILGDHCLVCGDSTSFEVVKRVLNNTSVEAIYADPPYGINVVSDSGRLGKSQKYRKVIGDENSNCAKDAYAMACALSIPIMIFWGANHYSSILPESSCWIVWDKQGGKSVTFADCELAWTNMKKPVRLFQHIWDGFRKDSEKNEKRCHPTQKPVALAQQILKLAEVKGAVLDPFGGSGATLIACEKSKLECYMIELSPAYCDVIVNRWINYRKKNGLSCEFSKNGVTFEKLVKEIKDLDD